jgi:hypothetical protein
MDTEVCDTAFIPQDLQTGASCQLHDKYIMGYPPRLIYCGPNHLLCRLQANLALLASKE